MNQPLALELASRTAAYRLDASPRATVEAARTAIVDTIAATLAGVPQACTRIARDSLGHLAPGKCCLAGGEEMVSVLDAAFVNGVASHALDFDDFTQDFGGHPSVPIVSGLLALAQNEVIGGMRCLEAYVAGVELETWIARGVHFQHYEKGWHPTSTLGVFGAAAAASRALRLDARTTATALAIAASMACGIKANFGTMTKPLHVGQCARSGVQAALLARGGFDANLAAFEHRQGFLEVYNGAGSYCTERMLQAWFTPPVVVSPGISIKQFPCCGSTHPAIYMALSLRERGIEPQRIRALHVLTHPRRLPHTDNPRPGNGLEAKFSIQYCVARALVSGAPRLSHFDDGAIHDPQVAALMARIDARAHPEMPMDSERNFGAEVIVEMEDAAPAHAFTEHLPGRGAGFPMTEGELEDKFRDCAGRVLDEAATDRLWQRLRRFEELRDLSGLLRRPPRPPHAVAS